MYCKIQSLSSNKTTKKDTLWSLSELLGQKVVASPQKTIQKKLFSTNQPRNLLTPQFDTKFQNEKKNMQKNQLKINFQFERLKSSFKQHRTQVFLKRSLTLNPKSSTQKITNNIKNQFQIPNRHSISIVNPHNQTKFKDYKNIKSKICSQKKMNFRDSQILFTKKYPEKFYKSSSVDLSKNSGFHSNINPEVKEINKNKKNFLKKGTSLQKQIVVNLLKNKIIKQHQFETQKQYSTREVLSMIKLYKGFHKDQTKNKQENCFLSKINDYQSSQKYYKNQFCPLNVVNKLKRPIQGWQIQPQVEIQ